MCIKGAEPKSSVTTPGPCFRVSENEPILFLKQVQGWNPFMQNDYKLKNQTAQNGHDSGRLYSVGFIIIKQKGLINNISSLSTSKD